MNKLIIIGIMIMIAQNKTMAQKDITSYIENKIVGKETPGFQYIVADTSGILYEYYGGYANLEKQIPVSPSTEFKAYSSTKTFTSLAFMQWVEAGKVSLDDTVGKVLDIPFSNTFTFRQVLSHTAGLTGKPLIRQIHLESEHDSFDLLFNTKILIDQSLKLTNAPGKKKKYSNFGYLLLGHAVSILSGMPYEEYIVKNVFGRLDSGGHYGFKFNENTAKGYQRRGTLMHFLYGLLVDKKKYYDTRIDGFQSYKNLYLNGPSYGGVFSNARGLLNYAMILTQENSPLLSDEFKRQLFEEQHLSNGKSAHHCLGWFVNKKLGTTCYSHAGGGGGYSCEVRIYPEKGIYSVYMMNTTQLPSHLKLLDKLDAYFIK